MDACNCKAVVAEVPGNGQDGGYESKHFIDVRVTQPQAQNDLLVLDPVCVLLHIGYSTRGIRS